MRRQRLRTLSEAEAYARCHGSRDADVKIVHIEPRRKRYQLKVSGEQLRRSFERKLARREPLEEELAVPAAADALPEPAPLEAEAAAAAGRREHLRPDE